MSRVQRADSFYSRWARIYEVISSRTPGIRAVRASAATILSPPAGGTVIEMGCATGPNFPYLRSEVGPAGTVVGIDVARGALRRSQLRIARSEWENVHSVRGDATRPPVRSADAVIGPFIVGMFDDPATTVHGWCDLVGEGGRVCLLDLAPSDRWYGPLPNLVLRTIVHASAPGRLRFRWDATRLLAERVTAAQSVLRERCHDRSGSEHWGGIIQITAGTVS